MGGWKLPQSIWANPFTVKQCGSVEKACEKYEEWIRTQPKLMKRLPELKGKVLGCWCKPGPCHGDVLVRLLDEVPEEDIREFVRNTQSIGNLSHLVNND
tara:strand:- start:405 stop:701 length:297 start_codon:yes stop_codon:yes gene_type:complete